MSPDTEAKVSSATSTSGTTGPSTRTEDATSYEEEMLSRLGTWIKRAEQALITSKTHALRPFELTVPQYATLSALTYAQDQSAAQLARTVRVSPQTMATILSNLESKGLITRRTSPVHGKVLLVRLTPRAEQVVEEANTAALKVEQDLAMRFSAEEMTSYLNYLERTIDCLAQQVQN